MEGESTSVENSREEAWRKIITSNNEEKRRDEPLAGPSHLEEKTFPRSKGSYKIQSFMPKYLQTTNARTTGKEAGTAKEMIKGQIELETEYEKIKGISRIARPGMRSGQIEEDPAQNEVMIEEASSKTDSLDIRRQEPGQSHSVANHKQDKELLGNLTSHVRRNNQNERVKRTKLEQERNNI